MHDPICTAVIAVFAAAAAAQQPLTAKSFLPPDHRNVLAVDLATMRANGVWDEIEIGATRLALRWIERETGMALRSIDRVVMIVDPGTRLPGLHGAEDGPKRVLVVEGNTVLGLPPGVQQWGEVERIGGTLVRSWHGEIRTNPTPETYVAGDEAWVRPVLAGERHGGVPAPDVLSLLAGSEPLVYFVGDVAAPVLRAELLDAVLPDTEWPDGDAPTFVCVRLLATGDPDDLHLVVEAIVRHARDGAGVEVTTAALAALRDRLVTTPQLRVVRPALTAATIAADRGDVRCTIDLGRARHALGNLGTLLVPLWTMAPVEQHVIVVHEVEPPPPPPPLTPPPPPPAPKKQ